jgi:polysaccharide biosynthesis transport protein
MTLLGLVGGAIYGTVALRPAYESRAAVLVQAITDDSSGVEPVAADTMGTERELVSADGVATLVQQRTGWRGTLDDLRRPLRVSQRGGTQTLTIAYRAGSPEQARLGAQSFAESYLAFRTSLAEAARDGSRRNLEAALRDVTDRNARVRTTLRSTPAGAEAAGDGLAEEAAPFRAGLAELAAVDTKAAGTVVEPASVPTAPAGAGPLQAGGIGALLGLATGVAVASLRGLADRRIRGRGDLEAQLGAPVLATVPRTRREGLDGSTLVTVALPDGPAAEAYRGLRARILAMAARSGLQTVMVASPTPTPEGATAAVAANLAASVASTGRRVALLSAEEMAPSEAAQVLDERREASDFVVVQAPPALSSADALTLAPMVDGIVVVADARHATREEIVEVGDQLRLVGGNVVGAVLCNAAGA